VEGWGLVSGEVSAQVALVQVLDQVWDPGLDLVWEQAYQGNHHLNCTTWTNLWCTIPLSLHLGTRHMNSRLPNYSNNIALLQQEIIMTTMPPAS